MQATANVAIRIPRIRFICLRQGASLYAEGLDDAMIPLIYSFIAARSFALRARGLILFSSSSAVIG